MSTTENPFERFDIDPTAGVEAITEHMRELAAEAPESQRQLVRDSWEALTLQPQRRIAAALSTFVDRDPAPVVGPRPSRETPPASAGIDAGVALAAVHTDLPPAGDLTLTSANDPLLEGLRT